MQGITSEKLAGPNLNSLRGFEVKHKIKYLLEEECHITVSCADILAMSTHDAVELRGGPRWEVLLGRMDALELSFSGANILIPAPNSSLGVLIDNFKHQGLDIEELVTLSGKSCGPYALLREGTINLHPWIFKPQKRFDNHYFINILEGKGLLGSDNVLSSHDLDGKITEQEMRGKLGGIVGLSTLSCYVVHMVWFPSMEDIEAFSTTNRTKLDEVELAKSIPDNICLEVCSLGVERIVWIPDDLD
ncbi:hypothetical protein JHK82_039608 [Glycine max]|nr:hypothetical protein JHK86_039797 [Glycine max]KAG4965401.1 hypothetical protein JHK85_040376 [Glycine max]KAG5110385.1 hypothetical protein JHK82_039608 [Glycine max]KAG5121670.1 hypothetical protein JHK84_040010 [Glycine max]